MSSTNWKKLGKRQGGNMKTNRNVKMDKAYYNNGKWDTVYTLDDIKRLAYYNIDLPNVVGIGTNEPFSKLSFGNSTGNGKKEEGDLKAGELSAIALHEKTSEKTINGVNKTLEGQDFKGISYVEKMKSVRSNIDNELSSGVAIFSMKDSVTKDSSLRTNKASIYITDDNFVQIGGKPKGFDLIDVRTASQKKVKTDTQETGPNIMLDISGSVHVNGFINFLKSGIAATGQEIQASTDNPANQLTLNSQGQFTFAGDSVTRITDRAAPEGAIWVGWDKGNGDNPDDGVNATLQLQPNPRMYIMKGGVQKRILTEDDRNFFNENQEVTIDWNGNTNYETQFQTEGVLNERSYYLFRSNKETPGAIFLNPYLGKDDTTRNLNGIKGEDFPRVSGKNGQSSNSSVSVLGNLSVFDYTTGGSGGEMLGDKLEDPIGDLTGYKKILTSDIYPGDGDDGGGLIDTDVNGQTVPRAAYGELGNIYTDRHIMVGGLIGTETVGGTTSANHIFEAHSSAIDISGNVKNKAAMRVVTGVNSASIIDSNPKDSIIIGNTVTNKFSSGNVECILVGNNDNYINNENTLVMGTDNSVSNTKNSIIIGDSCEVNGSSTGKQSGLVVMGHNTKATTTDDRIVFGTATKNRAFVIEEDGKVTISGNLEVQGDHVHLEVGKVVASDTTLDLNAKDDNGTVAGAITLTGTVPNSKDAGGLSLFTTQDDSTSLIKFSYDLDNDRWTTANSTITADVGFATGGKTAGSEPFKVTGDGDLEIGTGTANKFTVDSATGNTVVAGTLGVTGASTLASASVTNNATIGGTLGVTGNTTMSASLDLNSTADISDTLTLSKASGTGLSVTSNATIGGTLGVTGNTTMSGSLDLNSTADISDTLTLSKASGTGLSVTKNATIGGTLSVTGNTTMTGSLDLNSTADINDTLTLSKASGTGLSVTKNATIGGTLSVTGNTTMTGSLDLNSTADINDTLTLSKASGTGLSVTKNATIGGTLSVTGNTTMTGSLDLNSTADINDTLTLSKASGTGLSVTKNATIGGTLGVTGNTTMTGSLDLNSTADINDTLTLSKASGTGLSVTSNATVGGTLDVTGLLKPNGGIAVENGGKAKVRVYHTSGDIDISGNLDIDPNKKITTTGTKLMSLHGDYTGSGSTSKGAEFRTNADNKVDLYLSGKLNVDGLIDPTGLILDSNTNANISAATAEGKLGIFNEGGVLKYAYKQTIDGTTTTTTSTVAVSSSTNSGGGDDTLLTSENANKIKVADNNDNSHYELVFGNYTSADPPGSQHLDLYADNDTLTYNPNIGQLVSSKLKLTGTTAPDNTHKKCLLVDNAGVVTQGEIDLGQAHFSTDSNLTFGSSSSRIISLKEGTNESDGDGQNLTIKSGDAKGTNTGEGYKGGDLVLNGGIGKPGTTGQSGGDFGKVILKGWATKNTSPGYEEEDVLTTSYVKENNSGVYTHTAAEFKGNVTGDVTGDVKATNGTTILDSGTNGTDATFTGNVTGDVTGDVKATNGTTILDSGTNGTDATFTGNVTGDVTGDVKATNGTTILDSGTNGTDATFTGNVTGDVTGDVKATNGTTILDSGTNGTDATFTGNVTGDVTGDVKATNGTTILDSGTNGTDATFTGNVTGDVKGDVKATNGTTILDSGTNGNDATFTGNVTGNLDGVVGGTSPNAVTATVLNLDSGASRTIKIKTDTGSGPGNKLTVKAQDASGNDGTNGYNGGDLELQSGNGSAANGGTDGDYGNVKIKGKKVQVVGSNDNHGMVESFVDSVSADLFIESDVGYSKLKFKCSPALSGDNHYNYITFVNQSLKFAAGGAGSADGTTAPAGATDVDTVLTIERGTDKGTITLGEGNTVISPTIRSANNAIGNAKDLIIRSGVGTSLGNIQMIGDVQFSGTLKSPENSNLTLSPQGTGYIDVTKNIHYSNSDASFTISTGLQDMVFAPASKNIKLGNSTGSGSFVIQKKRQDENTFTSGLKIKGQDADGVNSNNEGLDGGDVTIEGGDSDSSGGLNGNIILQGGKCLVAAALAVKGRAPIGTVSSGDYELTMSAFNKSDNTSICNAYILHDNGTVDMNQNRKIKLPRPVDMHSNFGVNYTIPFTVDTGVANAVCYLISSSNGGTTTFRGHQMGDGGSAPSQFNSGTTRAKIARAAITKFYCRIDGSDTMTVYWTDNDKITVVE